MVKDKEGKESEVSYRLPEARGREVFVLFCPVLFLRGKEWSNKMKTENCSLHLA